jgi:hypothetical protein
VTAHCHTTYNGQHLQCCKAYCGLILQAILPSSGLDISQGTEANGRGALSDWPCALKNFFHIFHLPRPCPAKMALKMRALQFSYVKPCFFMTYTIKEWMLIFMMAFITFWLGIITCDSFCGYFKFYFIYSFYSSDFFRKVVSLASSHWSGVFFIGVSYFHPVHVFKITVQATHHNVLSVTFSVMVASRPKPINTMQALSTLHS